VEILFKFLLKSTTTPFVDVLIAMHRRGISMDEKSQYVPEYESIAVQSALFKWMAKDGVKCFTTGPFEHNGRKYELIVEIREMTE
jgi:hypothetical protein